MRTVHPFNSLTCLITMADSSNSLADVAAKIAQRCDMNVCSCRVSTLRRGMRRSSERGKQLFRLARISLERSALLPCFHRLEITITATATSTMHLRIAIATHDTVSIVLITERARRV